MSRFAWGTVDSVEPLRIRVDGDVDPLPFTPDSLVDPRALAESDRVRLELAQRRVLVLGRAGGSAGAFLRAHENLIINGDFRLNERQYASGTALTPGVLTGYAHDRWRTAGITNLVKNPRAATATTGWATSTGGGTSSLSRVATGGPNADAPSFIRFTCTSAVTTLVGNYGTNTADTILVVPGRTYTWAAWVRASAACTINIDAVAWNAAGSSVVTDGADATFALAANTWTRVTVTTPMLPYSARAAGRAYVTGALASGFTLDITGAVFAEALVDPGYIAGDLTGMTWVGTAHASLSVNRSVRTSYTFSQTPNGCTVTINSGGGLQQVIERASMPAGDYTLSWDGTVQARVYKNSVLTLLASIASGPLTFTTDGTDDIVVEFEAVGGTATLANVMLVAGERAFPYRPRPIGEELALAQRYYWATRSTTTGNARMFMGFQQSTTSAFATVNYPVTMRVLPIMTFTGAWYWSDLVTSDWAGTSLTILSTSARLDGCMVQLRGFSGGAQFRPGTLGLPGGSGGLYFHAEF